MCDIRAQRHVNGERPTDIVKPSRRNPRRKSSQVASRRPSQLTQRSLARIVRVEGQRLGNGGVEGMQGVDEDGTEFGPKDTSN